MSLAKYAGVSLIAMSASMGHAGGMEDTALSAGFMFEEGSYGNASIKSQSPSVKAKSAAGASITSGSLLGSVSSINLKAKMDVLDNMSVGISYYRQAGIKLDYTANWTTASGLTAGQIGIMPKVDLDVTALALIAKYDVNENISVLGGLKNGTASDVTASILGSGVSATATGASSLSYIAGAAYEIPEIAFRAELIYETKADYALTTEFAAVAIGGPADHTGATGKIHASTPDYINLYVQSGIAEDTLAYASMRQAGWKKSQVSVQASTNNALFTSNTKADLSDFADTTSYEIGLGRKFGTTWSSSIAYNWEGGSGPESKSFFTLTDGRQGISVGVKYNFNENTAISFGGNYTAFGKVTQAAVIAGNSRNAIAGTVFSGNTATTLGANISHSF